MRTQRPHQICSRCIMDTTDPEIVFDAEGVCNHCHAYDLAVGRQVFSGPEGLDKLDKIVSEIKQEGKGKDYDCIIGVSGGVDSTYVAYKVKALGLKPLAVHLDNGWDSELAVKNIESVLRNLKIDLYTHVIDWEEFRDLQMSFLKASTPDAEVPSDHAIFSLMHQMAEKIKTKYVITGFNVRTEMHLPRCWSQGHMDWKYIKSVHGLFGTVPLKTFPHTTLPRYYYWRKKQKWLNILNYLDYSKTQAIQVLEKDLGWRYYGGKHYESIYTRFYQGFLLLRKFGFDKRKAHFSSCVCSGEMTRNQALEEMKQESYPPELQKQDREYVMKKFGLTNEGFEAIMRLPLKTYWDYPSSFGRMHSSALYKALKRVRAFVGVFRKPK